MNNGRAALKAAMAALWTLSALGAAVAAARAIRTAPPPGTVAHIFPAQDTQPGEAWRPACNGILCMSCQSGCFLPEGAAGRCAVRVNNGGQLKLAPELVQQSNG